MLPSTFTPREWGSTEQELAMVSGPEFREFFISSTPFGRLKHFNPRDLSIGDEVAMLSYYHPEYDRKLHEGLFVARILDTGQPVLRSAYMNAYLVLIGSAPHMSGPNEEVEYTPDQIMQGWDLCVQPVDSPNASFDESQLALGAPGIQQVWVNGVRMM